MRRLEEIQVRFDHHYEIELGLAVTSLDLPRWACLTALGPQVNYGWAYPVAVHPDERSGDVHGVALSEWADRYAATWKVGDPDLLPFVFIYSPEVMADSTMQLDEGDLGRYLTAVEFLIDKYVSVRLTVPDPAQRLIVIENDLYEVHPSALALVTRVQMAALPPVVPHE